MVEALLLPKLHNNSIIFCKKKKFFRNWSHDGWFSLTALITSPLYSDTELSSGDILGDLPADASEEEIATRLAAAGIDKETAKKMVGAVKGGGSKSEFFLKKIFEMILSTSHMQQLLSFRKKKWTWGGLSQYCCFIAYTA